MPRAKKVATKPATPVPPSLRFIPYPKVKDIELFEELLWSETDDDGIDLISAKHDGKYGIFVRKDYKKMADAAVKRAADAAEEDDELED